MLDPSDSALRSSPEVRAALDRLILRRGRLLMVLGFLATASFSALNHLAFSPPPRWTDLMNLAIAAVLGGALLVTRTPFGRRHVVALCLILGVLGAGVRAWAGIWHGNVAPTAIFLVVMAMASAATLPWGFWAQAVAATTNALAVLVNAVVVMGDLGPPPRHAAAAVALGLAGSAILAAEMRRHYTRLFVDNLRRRQAEAALARLNAELERRVEERTAQLSATSGALEREAQERRSAETELRESQRRLQAVLDHAGVAIYLRDLEDRYLLVNRYWLQLAGREAHEVLGRTLDDIMPPELVATVRAHDAEVLAASHSLQFEERIPQLDGWHTFLTVKFAWPGPDGRPVGIWGLATDITDRQQAEAELRRSRAALLAVIENTTDAIWSVDRQGAVTVMNRAARVRLAHGEPLAPDGPLGTLYARALAGEHVQLERSAPDGRGLRHTLDSLHPIVERGEVIGVTVFSRDITGLKQAEQAARRHQAELAHVLRLSTMGEMAAGLAHEINQPLGAIANYAQGCARRLRAGGIDGDQILPVVEQIAHEALRAGEIIRRLRDLVRKDSGRVAPADVNQLVRESLRLIEPEARSRGIDLRAELAPRLPPVPCDGIQIEQVLLNLLLNGVDAIEAAGDGERAVAVRTALAERAIEVAVSDSGIGLPELPADVFAPFYTTKTSGLGMGLSISRSIIEAHGGQLWGLRNPDRGSTFRFTLPAAE